MYVGTGMPECSVDIKVEVGGRSDELYERA